MSPAQSLHGDSEYLSHGLFKYSSEKYLPALSLPWPIIPFELVLIDIRGGSCLCILVFRGDLPQFQCFIISQFDHLALFNMQTHTFLKVCGETPSFPPAFPLPSLLGLQPTENPHMCSPCEFLLCYATRISKVLSPRSENTRSLFHRCDSSVP